MNTTSAPETIQEATERRLRQVTEMVGEIRWLMERGEVPGQRELDFVRTADAALYDCAVLLRSSRAVSEGTPGEAKT